LACRKGILASQYANRASLPVGCTSITECKPNTLLKNPEYHKYHKMPNVIVCSMVIALDHRNKTLSEQLQLSKRYKPKLGILT
jgi:hypothetical protein